MQALDLRPDHLQWVQDILKKHVPEREVWAFGSRAKWLAKEYSDLDLCIVGPTSLSLTTLSLLKEAFEESNLPWKVDVVDWATTSETFRKIIERDKVVVQEVRIGRAEGAKWQASTVGDFCPFIYGKGLPERTRIPGAFPVISSAGISGSHNKALVTTGGIVIGRKGTVGSITLSKSAFWPIDTVFYIEDEPQRDLRFTYYLLKTLGLDRMNSDSAVPGLNRGNAHARPIFVPPLPEQRAIAHILGTLDDKIELLRKQNETLEAMARALFKAWFVDFEPVRAKMEGRWQRGQSLPGLPEHLYDLFPERLVESELGEIPEGWEIIRIGNIGNVICGKTPSTKIADFYGKDIPFITIPEMHGNIFACNIKKRLSSKGAESQMKKMLPSGTICVSCIATLGLVNITTEPSQTNQQINSVIPAEEKEAYFWYWTLRNMGEAIKAGGSGGSVLDNLSTGRFAELQVNASFGVLRLTYNSSVGNLFSQILANAVTSKTLCQLRDTLLPKLISGELRVPDAERIIRSTG